MTWDFLVAGHAVAALYVLALGPINIFRRRRDRTHRRIGYIWVGAIYYVCISSFWIQSEGGFTWLHGLSVFTLVTVSLGLRSAIRRNIPAHVGNMVGSYLGTLAAFTFAVAAPGRRIPQLLAHDPATAVFVGVLVAATAVGIFLAFRKRPAVSVPQAFQSP